MQYRLILWLLFLLTACSTLPPSKTSVSATPGIATVAPTTPTPVALRDTIGQPIQGGMITFTVNELTATMGAGRGDAPRGGHFYLVANLTIQNTSITDTTPYDSANLVLLASDGTIYPPITVDIEPLLESGTLNAGESITANAVFEVSDSASGLVMRYLYNGNEPPIHLELGLIPAPFRGVQ